MGIGLAKIKAKGLYIDLEYRSMAKYIESLCDEFQMERSGLRNWLYIGEAYLKYRRELEKVGFSDEDGPTKLPYVERALALYQKKTYSGPSRICPCGSLSAFPGGKRRPLRKSPPSG
ncbi:MAG: hypothetical protein LBE10_07010 [Treponema sp.]|jgi:hypothetical protein|nr:hypothetical protein [Treponema sp.]